MPYIISPYREIEMGQKARVSGHVKIKKVDREGRITFESEFDNLVLDEFLQNGFTNAYRAGLYMSVGTGVQTTPQPSDTALGNAISAVQCDPNSFFDHAQLIVGPSYDQDFLQQVFTAEFDYPDAIGDLTELGLSIEPFSATNPRFLTKALIRDSSGTPTLLAKTEAEKLIIDYEIRHYRPSTGPLDVNLNGQDIRFQNLPIRIDDTSTTSAIDSAYWDGNSYRANMGYDILLSVEPYGFSYHRYNSPMNKNLYRNTFFFAHSKLENASGYGSAYVYGGYEDKTNNVFTFHNRCDPDTVDRQAIGLFTTPFGNSASPEIMPLISPGRTYISPEDVVALNPSDNTIKTFTLPAGYRLDFVWSFERTR